MAAPRREFSMPAEDRSLEALLDGFLIHLKATGLRGNIHKIP
jgi:hypothetical protein